MSRHSSEDLRSGTVDRTSGEGFHQVASPDSRNSLDRNFSSDRIADFGVGSIRRSGDENHPLNTDQNMSSSSSNGISDPRAGTRGHIPSDSMMASENPNPQNQIPGGVFIPPNGQNQITNGHIG